LRAVSNSSPLIALEKIGKLDLLRELFSAVIIPPAVATEIAPTVTLPSWIKVDRLRWRLDPRTIRPSLVTEVSLARAGIVLGLEVSRLARNSMDWHRLLEICALTDTLILDEDGVYDPAHFNDRLLLGLKGTMSEAELHVLRARLQG
jgi:hypothetical protein